MRVQADEVWSFCYAKEKNVPAKLKGKEGYGSVWTWTALDADSKLMISWIVSDRSQDAANAIIGDLKSRGKYSPHCSDSRPSAVYCSGEADHAEVIKVFAGRLLRVEKRVAFGEPSAEHASTSYMERWNLTLRMQNAASPASRTASARSWRTTVTCSPSRWCSTTSAARTSPSRADSGDGCRSHGLRLDRE